MKSRRLVRVERTINVYDNKNNKLIEEISVDGVPFDELKSIVTPNEDDPLLYDGYDLDIEQLENLNMHLAEKVKPDFKQYSYILVCGGIYEW
jgi:hypothetical protein